MTNHIATLLLALTINFITMAVALPAVMGKVNPAARRSQAGVVLQAIGWGLLLASGLAVAGSWPDRLLSSLSMACLAGSLALLGMAFNLWCGRNPRDPLLTVVAGLLPIGYALGFSSYAFRVLWANALMALLMLWIAAALARPPAEPVGRWRWVLVVSLLAQMVVTAWRGILGGFFTESYPAFLAPHPVNYAFAIVSNSTAVLSLTGILLAHRDDADRALERLASLDGLTGVYNRRAWLLQASSKMAESRRYGHSLAVLMIDLDHFKRVNDSLGHEAGDRALAFMAQSMQTCARSGDVIGRYGGEEFCVLMSHADALAARAFDDRLRLRLADGALAELGFGLSYSAGIALLGPVNDTLATLLRRADDTLYRAKNQGRDRTLEEHPAPTLRLATGGGLAVD